MVQPHSALNREQVVDTMIELTRLSNLHRAIVAGSGSLELYLALRRRGFIRVATTATCRIPRAQHAVGLITGQNSLEAIEAALAQISQFLCTSAAIAVLIDSRESGFCLKSEPSWSRWVSGSRRGSGASRALCFPRIDKASAKWKTQREIR